MSTGLYSGASGLALGVGLYAGNPGLWSGAPGLITGDGASLYLDFLAGAPLDSRITFTRTTTATVTGSNGVIQSSAINDPRFDYDPVTLASRGLLIEEQRTNLLVRSQEFDNASWTKSSTSVTANAATSPDGTADADKLIAASAVALTSCSIFSAAVTKSAVATTYTYTAYAKAAEFNRARLYIQDIVTPTNLADVTVSLVDGSITNAARVAGTFSSASANVLDTGSGWWRVSLTFTSSTETSLRARIYLADSVATTGDGIGGIYIYGAQLEAGAFATSYIPTVASTVTRSADVATMTGTNFSSWYNQSAGTFVVGYDILGFAANHRMFSATDNSIANEIAEYTSTGSNRMLVVAGGVTVATPIGLSPITVGTVYTAALAAEVNNFAISVNGNAAVTDTSGAMTTGLSRLNIGSNYLGANQLNGYIRTIAYYNTRLPDATLQALTA